MSVVLFGNIVNIHIHVYMNNNALDNVMYTELLDTTGGLTVGFIIIPA